MVRSALKTRSFRKLAASTRWTGTILLVVHLLACAHLPNVPPPVGAPYTTGTVTSLTHRTTATGILVTSKGEPCDLLAVADADTRRLRRSEAGNWTEVPFAEIRVGDLVEVYFERPVAESCPLQGRASAIVLVSHPDR